MTDVVASSSFRGLAAASAVECVHDDLEGLWREAPFVGGVDQMTFSTAVIESVSNVVQHAEPAGSEPVELAVEITVKPARLQARISALHAEPPFGLMEPKAAADDDESGRGLRLIQALVTTVTFERQDSTNTWVLTRHSH
ncbi:ATP-binding protein [Pseudarthrobacter sp. NPDC092439]|uniref:ATP-binding protein n=1 Tax=unclassified Pseudarthrobacter TaxID=2647000 RepID=UPI0037F61341